MSFDLNKLQGDLKEAMIAHDESRVGTLRLLINEIHNWQIEKQVEPKESDLTQIVQQQVKRRKEAAEAYRQGGRVDLAEKEEQESTVLMVYLPAQLSEEEWEKLVKETIVKIGASGPADFGKVMGSVMEQVKGQTDGNTVSQIVKRLLV
jgi:uncharacterized protein